LIEPRERLLWALVAVGIVGLCGVVAPVVGGAAPWALLGLGIAVVVDALRAGAPSSVLVQRRLPARVVVGEASSVVYAVSTTSKRALSVEVTESLPHLPWTSFAVVVDRSPVDIEVARGPQRRGHHGHGRLAVRTVGPLGLVARRHRRAGAGDEVVVGFDTMALANTAQRLLRGDDDGGARQRVALLQGRELDGLRDYRRGDDVRLVDWKATARRGDLVVKQLVPETRQDTVVVVDAGRQMMAGTDGVQARFEHAVQAGLVVAAAALLRGDRCGFVTLDDDVRSFVPPVDRIGSLKRLADSVEAVNAVPVEPAWAELSALLLRRLQRRSLVCVITDVVDEPGARHLVRALSTLRGRHAVLVIAVSTAHANTNTNTNTDEAMTIAARLLHAHRRAALQALRAHAVVVDVVDHKAAADAVSAWWQARAR
jgi:uncharacterized protein (DUF58 family)